MRRVLIPALAAGLLCGVWAEAARRVDLRAMEKSFDARLIGLSGNPFTVLGSTRGLYLEGYGAVFTAEMNLVPGLSLSPFRQSISKEEIARVRAKKIEQMPLLRKTMQTMLVSAAASLDDVPKEERLVLGITLLYLPAEDSAGMPSKIVMQGQRGRLLEAKLGSGSADSAVTVEEF